MPLPFPGMDKSGAAVCELYVRSTCHMGTSCPFRHVRGDKVLFQKNLYMYMNFILVKDKWLYFAFRKFTLCLSFNVQNFFRCYNKSREKISK